MDALALFCASNGLTVSIKKTKWLVGGRVPRGGLVEQLTYRGQLLERVQEFRYLGLVFTPGASLPAMSGARLVAAKRAWGVL